LPGPELVHRHVVESPNLEIDMARKPAKSTAGNLDEMPDTVRRRDQPEPGAPRTVPRPGENVRIGGVSPPEDGGVAEHPIHDYDLEDLDAEDYERMTDEVARTGIKRDR
jgi:hypothetical protein